MPACSTHNRTYTIIFGATLLPFGFIPSFRKMRVILIIGVIGTIYTGCYGIYVASQKGFAEASQAHVWPSGPDTGASLLAFFNGVAVIFAILDHHDIFGETIEAMQHPRRWVCAWSYACPHGINCAVYACTGGAFVSAACGGRACMQ